MLFRRCSNLHRKVNLKSNTFARKTELKGLAIDFGSLLLGFVSTAQRTSLRPYKAQYLTADSTLDKRARCEKCMGIAICVEERSECALSAPNRPSRCSRQVSPGICMHQELMMLISILLDCSRQLWNVAPFSFGCTVYLFHEKNDILLVCQ